MEMFYVGIQVPIGYTQVILSNILNIVYTYTFSLFTVLHQIPKYIYTTISPYIDHLDTHGSI